MEKKRHRRMKGRKTAEGGKAEPGPLTVSSKKRRIKTQISWRKSNIISEKGM